MGAVLAVDPGTVRSGVAIFLDGELVHASSVAAKVMKGQPAMSRVYSMYQGITKAASQIPAPLVVLEWPQVYGGRGVNPNHLLPVAALCGALVVKYRQYALYSPREWTGGVQKATTVKGAKTSPRGKSIENRLDGGEKSVWEGIRYHDTVDAIGLGLHHLGRV